MLDSIQDQEIKAQSQMLLRDVIMVMSPVFGRRRVVYVFYGQQSVVEAMIGMDLDLHFMIDMPFSIPQSTADLFQPVLDLGVRPLQEYQSQQSSTPICYS